MRREAASIRASVCSAVATLLAARQGLWLREQAGELGELPAPLAETYASLNHDYPPVIEDRALEAELRQLLSQLRAQHWRLYAR